MNPNEDGWRLTDEESAAEALSARETGDGERRYAQEVLGDEYRDRELVEDLGEVFGKRQVYEVCPLCLGSGRTVNPSIDGQGLTREDFEDLGEDFERDYFAGVYDVPCRRCHGQRVVTRESEAAYAEDEQDRRTMIMESGERPDYW